MDHSGKLALVTGACSGIGRNISEVLAADGYNIIGISNRLDSLSRLKTDLEKDYGITVIPLETDLAREESATLIHIFCRENHLQVEVLVNNAGMLIYGEACGTDPDKIKQLLNLHIITPVMLCRLFGEQMAARGKGYIMNVSSISAVMPYPTISLYGPSKAFLKSFTRAIRTELKPHGVKVTCLIPGATDTSFYDQTDFSIGIMGKKLFVKKPEYVASAGVRALFRNRPVCIPGMLNKCVVWFIPLIPYSLINLIYRKRIRMVR